MGRGQGFRHRLAASLAGSVAITFALAAATLGPGAVPAAAADPLVYVALGDSYTSGPLVLPHDTTYVPQDCGQSARNYPHLAALLLGVDVLRDVSCGGAKIDHLFEAQDGLTLGGVNAPQADVLGPEVDVVTVGLGGNDVGFVGVALGCMRLGSAPPLGQPPCHPSHVVDGVDRVAVKIAAMEAELTAALHEIQRRAPNADVFVVSYPTSLPDSGVACWPYLPILPEDMPYLVAWFKAMNTALASAAAAAGAAYVDVYTPSIGHDACQPPGVAWVNGFVLVPPSYPAHPNDLSYLTSAPVVADAIRARQHDAGPPVAEPRRDPSATSSTTHTVPAEGARPVLPATGGGGLALPGAAATAAALAGLALARRWRADQEAPRARAG